MPIPPEGQQLLDIEAYLREKGALDLKGRFLTREHIGRLLGVNARYQNDNQNQPSEVGPEGEAVKLGISG